MILQQNQKYQATVSNSLLLFVSNERIKSELEKIGFDKVEVSGKGKERSATGVFSAVTKDVKLPTGVKETDIKKI